MKINRQVATLATTVITFGSLAGNVGAATLITFNDGTASGSDISNFYSTSGVIFTNGEWSDLSSGFTPHPDSDGLRLSGDGANAQPKSGSPISLTFTTSMAVVSVIANNVNANGARIDIYDSEVGGNLINSHQVVGPSGALDSNFVLTASGSGIRRVELYQPFNVESEGVLFDNLEFDSVPEPSSSLFLGLAGLGLSFRRSRL
ncbi:PEP-CTERM sorting domain-containing protein [Verrucomicrobiaceae bacterium 5K15]|uniref:PEP-CTERM sorting domain-containing protein n=1 Tax=Oceaniferula flava TaxID=2800421 RepID=A0AAE2SAM0_9BACT|nr:PEP-CTERM sorting domain-containing protein [Oceaniferula flavus]MBK1854596.1 PEP-CTERM sorting domain-containing protein [Oceaniferula flavus]MBM1135902.1 PEP-CTERM sorting domain-containing protein [Oceaniferula flavus]